MLDGIGLMANKFGISVKSKEELLNSLKSGEDKPISELLEIMALEISDLLDCRESLAKPNPDSRAIRRSKNNYEIDCGSIEVITGPMFSGKTRELIRRLDKAKHAKQEILLVKPSIDKRYSDKAAISHNGDEFPSIYLDPGIEYRPCEFYTAAADVIAFDEAQFFSDDLVYLCEFLAGPKMQSRVIIAGLDLDYKGRPFGPMPQLMAIADKVDKLTAICSKCGKEAHRTQRITGNGEIIKVGGAEMYEARCKNCWNPTNQK